MAMRDEAGNEITDPDLTAGYLTEETETVHHDAVAEVAEQSHMETVKEYPNGSKEVKKVIDVEGVAGKEAYDETVNYLEYHVYTTEQKNAQTITELKAKLSASDYVAAKLADGSGTAEHYADIIKQRQEWRDEINKLEV